MTEAARQSSEYDAYDYQPITDKLAGGKMTAAEATDAAWAITDRRIIASTELKADVPLIFKKES